MRTQVRSYFRSTAGASAIEYGLIAALVAVAAIVALDSLGGSLVAIFNLVSTELSEAATQASSS